jgi:hypothetical protein
MFRLHSGRNLLALSLMACAVFLFASPAQAQTGAVQGNVLDAAGKPLEKAVITIEFTDGINCSMRSRPTRRASPDLAPAITSTASFEVGYARRSACVRPGDPMKLEFRLAATGGTAEDKAVAPKAVVRARRVSARTAANDEAIAKFTEAAGMVPGYDCLANVGFNHAQKKEYDQAEAAFMKAIEMKANYGGLQRAGDSQRPEEVRQGRRSQHEGDRAGRRGRPRRGRRRRGRRVQPGRHRLERRPDRVGGRSLPEGHLHEA